MMIHRILAENLSHAKGKQGSAVREFGSSIVHYDWGMRSAEWKKPLTKSTKKSLTLWFSFATRVPSGTLGDFAFRVLC